MADKPFKPCNKVGCHELTREKYCNKHIDQEKFDKAQTSRHYDKQVRYAVDNQKYAKFYHSKEWKAVRKVALYRDLFLCRDCFELDKNLTPGDVVDHIVELKDNWDLRLDVNNLRTLCHTHHAVKTANEKKKREKI